MTEPDQGATGPDEPSGPPRFVRTDLTGAVFDDVDLTGARFREAMMTGVRMDGVVLVDAHVDGLVRNLTVNGVEVMPFVVAELDRRHPVRPLLRSTDPQELVAGWAGVRTAWRLTAARIVALPDELAHVRVDDEWSAVETLRHLVFVADSWFRSTVLGVPDAFHPIGLAASFVPDQAAMGLDPDVRPSLADVLEVRVAQQDQITAYLAERLDADELSRVPTTTEGPGWPPHPEQQTVLSCLHVLLEEEFAHHQFCVRDLNRLDRDRSDRPQP